jgi:hypothetical protein
MKQNLLALFVLSAFTFSSCKKDKTDEQSFSPTNFVAGTNCLLSEIYSGTIENNATIFKYDDQNRISQISTKTNGKESPYITYSYNQYAINTKFLNRDYQYKLNENGLIDTEISISNDDISLNTQTIKYEYNTKGHLTKRTHDTDIKNLDPRFTTVQVSNIAITVFNYENGNLVGSTTTTESQNGKSVGTDYYEYYLDRLNNDPLVSFSLEHLKGRGSKNLLKRISSGNNGKTEQRFEYTFYDDGKISSKTTIIELDDLERFKNTVNFNYNCN